MRSFFLRLAVLTGGKLFDKRLIIFGGLDQRDRIWRIKARK